MFSIYMDYLALATSITMVPALLLVVVVVVVVVVYSIYVCLPWAHCKSEDECVLYLGRGDVNPLSLIDPLAQRLVPLVISAESEADQPHPGRYWELKPENQSELSIVSVSQSETRSSNLESASTFSANCSASPTWVLMCCLSPSAP